MIITSHFNYFLFRMSLSSQFHEAFCLANRHLLMEVRSSTMQINFQSFPCFSVRKEHMGERTRQLKPEIHKSEGLLQVHYSNFGIFINVIDYQDIP